ncbi:YoaK family protein [Mycolicibacterium smegmatis]|uniref:YoaK family protein n=1 Tax=Mycolicibacterium smegmatis TaxID=1772 RepID=UPI001303B3FF|nr:YoaK family protein [Mycolicibacterium smegmatis]
MRTRWPIIAAFLAFGSGALDVLALTHLGGVFASVMTGNLALMGFAIAHADTAVLTHAFASVAGYTLGVGGGARLIGMRPRESSAWPRAVSAVLIVELIVLAALSAGWAAGYVCGVRVPQLALLITAAAGMGLQSAAVRELGVPLATTYLTGTLTSLVARRAASAGKHADAADVAAVVAFLVGAVASGLTLAAAPATAPLLCICPLASVIVTCARRPSAACELPSRWGAPRVVWGQQGGTCGGRATDGDPGAGRGSMTPGGS